MTDENITPEFVEESIPDEPVVHKRCEPEGNGFTRRTKADFATYNAQATADIKAETYDKSLVQYTYSLPDTDPNYCWVREEGIYTKRLSAQGLASIKTKEEAVAISMKIESAEQNG